MNVIIVNAMEWIGLYYFESMLDSVVKVIEHVLTLIAEDYENTTLLCLIIKGIWKKKKQLNPNSDPGLFLFSFCFLY